jgi:hypothetical protein
MKQGNARGWRRIGIVLSIIWFVGFGGWLWIDSVRENADFYGGLFGMCYSIQSETGRRECQEHADDYYRTTSAKLQSPEVLTALVAIDAGTVALGWSIVMGAVALVCRARRGSHSAEGEGYASELARGP